MFKILKKFVIYLLLLPHTFPQPINKNDNDKETTPDDEQEVEKNILSFAKYLNKIPDDVERAEFRGELRMLVRRAVKADKLLQNQGRLETEKNDHLQKVKNLTVPLVFRNYATKIEDKFPDKPPVPPNVMRNQQFHQGVLQRKYHWIDILSKEKNSKDVHVKLLKKALKEKFFLEEKINVEKEIQDLNEDQKQKYSEFLENFCEGIAVAVDHVNKIVAHNDFGRYPIDDLLNVFEPAYDEYVSLFYKAVVGPL